jgi:colanic acid biosynthesis glycosyl transferase WcaI
MGRHWLDGGHRMTVFTAVPNRPQGVIHPGYRGRLVVDEQMHGMRVVRTWVYASPKGGFVRTIANNASFLVCVTPISTAYSRGVNVLVASAPPFFPHIAGWMVAAARRIPLVLEVRDLWPDYLVGMGILRATGIGARAVFAAERALLRRASRVVVVTESFKRRIIDKGVSADRVAVVSNGVDTSFYRRQSTPRPIDGLLRRPGEVIVGYLGNFGAGQRLVQLIDGVVRARAIGVPARLVLVGDGPDRPNIDAAATSAGADAVTVLPSIDKDLTPSFHAQCDVGAVVLAPFTILQETVPSKLFEILACERPVLGVLAGEAADIIRASGGGVVVPPGDPAAIAAALQALAGLSPEARALMGASGRKYVSREYDRAALAARYLAVLEAAHAEGRRSTSH